MCQYEEDEALPLGVPILKGHESYVFGSLWIPVRSFDARVLQ